MQELSRAASWEAPGNLPSHPVTGRGAGPQHQTWRNRFVLGEFTIPKKSLLDKLYIPNSASNICISIVYAVLLTSHFLFCFFLHACKSPQRSLTNFPYCKFHHFKSVQHQDTTKLLSQPLVLWTQPGLSTPMIFKLLGCLVGGYQAYPKNLMPVANGHQQSHHIAPSLACLSVLLVPAAWQRHSVHASSRVQWPKAEWRWLS